MPMALCEAVLLFYILDLHREYRTNLARCILEELLDCFM